MELSRSPGKRHRAQLLSRSVRTWYYTTCIRQLRRPPASAIYYGIETDLPSPKVRSVEVSVVNEINSLTGGVETGLHMGRDEAAFMICEFEKRPMDQNTSVVIL